MSAANGQSGPVRGHSAHLWAAVTAAAVALVLAALAPPIGPWGDGLGILAGLADESGRNARVYHLGYGLLARAAVALGDGLGLGHEAVLVHLSRAAIALGAALTAWVAVALGARPLAAAGWTAVVVASPSLLFFSGVVEVHGVQFLGSALALALTALGASRERVVERYGAVVAAAALALALHLSHLLLVPALLVAVLPSAGRARREWAAAAGLVALGALVALGSLATYRAHADGPPTGLLRGPWFLGLYESLFLDFRERFGWFGPLEQLRFLGTEGLGQGGLAWSAGLLALVLGRGRVRAVGLVLLLVYLAVVAQSGLRERGGYFVSLFPWFAAGAALAGRGRGPGLCLLPWLLLPPQVWLAWRELSAYAERGDARAWARGVVALVERPCTVFTSDMVRLSALPLEPGGLDGLQWSQQFEYTPRRNWDERLAPPYRAAVESALRSGRVYLDADVVAHGAPPERVEPWQRWAAELFDRPDVELVEVPPREGGRALLLEVRVVAPPR